MTDTELRREIKTRIARKLRGLTDHDRRQLLYGITDAIADQIDGYGLRIDDELMIDAILDAFQKVKCEPFRIAQEILDEEEDKQESES